MFDDLYPRVAAAMKPARFLHSLGVCHAAVQLAPIHGVSMREAALAGLLHDYCKDMSADNLKKRLSRAGWDHAPLKESEKKIWHAWAGETALKSDFSFADSGLDLSSVALAIRWHPTGHPDMDKLAKIIFVADYTEPGRRFRGSLEEIRATARRDLDAAILMALEEKSKYLDKLAGKCVHPWTLTALDRFRELAGQAPV